MKFVEPLKVGEDWVWAPEDPADFLALQFSSDTLDHRQIAVAGNRIIYRRIRLRSGMVDPDSPEGFLLNGEFDPNKVVGVL